jgi:hypothetical protein
MSDDELKQQLKRVFANSLNMVIDSEPGAEGWQKINVALYFDGEYICSDDAYISTN